MGPPPRTKPPAPAPVPPLPVPDSLPGVPADRAAVDQAARRVALRPTTPPPIVQFEPEECSRCGATVYNPTIVAEVCPLQPLRGNVNRCVYPLDCLN